MATYRKNYRGDRIFWIASAIVPLTCLLDAGADQIVRPAKDGTLVDGGIFGAFDGIADNWDWTFNQTSYEGAVTLTTSPASSRIEHRVVWEYDLSGLVVEPPVWAILSFELRGAPVFPFPDVRVHVYSYPADLVESPSDYFVGPNQLVGSATVVPFQPLTEYSVVVTAEVNAALSDGIDRVGFRFQIDPTTAIPAGQAFFEALDTDPTSKPHLVIRPAGPPVPGDYDGDGDVDLADYSAFVGCRGTNESLPQDCDTFDFDADGDVDLRDFGMFQTAFGANPF